MTLTSFSRLWGNPTHLDYIASALRQEYGGERLVILTCKRNAGSFTYDGIEVGAERVAKEIEETLEELARDGYKVKKLSMVGYSLGGLVARYAIGLLHHKGWFDKIYPANFTTFATPHLGVRTPLLGYTNHLWNVLGARTLSTSGRQLFAIDSFRDTGRPLLSVLADPDSIFIQALGKFENRSLYTNIVNDRTAVYYTTGISRTDPYARMEKLELNYLKEYEPILLDPKKPFTIRKDDNLPSFYTRIASRSQTFLKRFPILLALAVIIPIASVAFLINSTIQTMRSRRRIQLHETECEGRDFSSYRVPFMVQDAQQAIEDAFENVNSAQRQEYLPDGSEEMLQAERDSQEAFHDLLPDSLAGPVPAEKPDTSPLVQTTSHQERHPEFSTLALTPAQFAMIKALDDVGFRKYPVHIHNSSHSHAAIIVRHARGAFEEGKLVVAHWLKEEFKI